MKSIILLIGSLLLHFFAFNTYLAENMIAARPYVTGGIILIFIALAERVECK